MGPLTGGEGGRDHEATMWGAQAHWGEGRPSAHWGEGPSAPLWWRDHRPIERGTIRPTAGSH